MGNHFWNASDSTHWLSWVKNTPGFFNQGWVHEENKAVLILIRHQETSKRQSSLGKYEHPLNWLGIESSFCLPAKSLGQKDILHTESCMSLAQGWVYRSCLLENIISNTSWYEWWQVCLHLRTSFTSNKTCICSLLAEFILSKQGADLRHTSLTRRQFINSKAWWKLCSVSAQQFAKLWDFMLFGKKCKKDFCVHQRHLLPQFVDPKTFSQ